MKEYRYQAMALAGEAGSGKTSVAAECGRRLGWQSFGAGELFREWCRVNGVSEVGANLDQEEVHDAIDSAMLVKLMEGKVVVEGRVAGLVAAVNRVPRVLKVLLLCANEERYQRIFERERGVYTNLAEVKEETDLRESQNLATFTTRYNGISYMDEGLYDYVLDSTDISLAQTVSLVLANLII